MSAPRPKVVHRAKHIREDGAVSALCFTTLRAIDMKRASWTFTAEAVTCRKCRDAQGIKSSATPAGREAARRAR